MAHIFLSIITINYNNCKGLEKTLNSVLCQCSTGFEHVIIDGGSSDGSREIIEVYASNAPYRVGWVSEKDNGIYNAMNKGIKRVKGEYIQILNSGDCLASNDVVEKMLNKLVELNANSVERIPIFYGNMIKVWPNGKRWGRKSNKSDEIIRHPFKFIDFYKGTLDHDGAFILRSLYDKFGYYDETLRICSDWKWMMNTIVFNNISPVYINIDVILFDMTGVSENDGKQRELIMQERDSVLRECVPEYVLKDYACFYEDIMIMKRIHRHRFIYLLVRFMERCLFKLEKFLG